MVDDLAILIFDGIYVQFGKRSDVYAMTISASPFSQLEEQLEP